MPILRPFRALRFDATSTDLSAVLAPPYDVISPAQRQELLARDPHNIVRIELPADLGTAGPDDYRAAAATTAAWREAGILVKDAEPSVTVHEMRWSDAEGRPHSATGLLCRLGLEEYGPAAGVLPHEKTHGGPKADRYALLEATQINTSPLVFLAGSDPAATSAALLAMTERAPDAEATTADGVSHRLWICGADEAALVLELMSAVPLTIADGHHRYETALKYRADHEADREADADPAWDYLLALIYPQDQSPPALPTHRVIRGRPCGDDLLERLAPYAAIERLPDRETLLARMSAPAELVPGATGTGRIGIYTGRDPVAAILTVDRAATDALLDADLSEGSTGLDVNALSMIIDKAFGDGAATMAADGRLWYVKDATDATAQVVEEKASAAFLLDGMPPAAISLVAEADEVMPQKSTYFNPKAPTGLLLSPLEW
ncbi:MAG: DUF1015 domain-containing protein [Chloroflexota bacterium]|nr:DUF1015 domain-containing protein [Chloroflexota bacterium]